MSDDHAPAGGFLTCFPRQFLHDVRVGESVEAVAHHALAPEIARNRKLFRNLRTRAMEGRVETAILRETRVHAADGFHRLDLMRQVLGRERNQRAQGRYQLRRDSVRPRVIAPAINNPMPRHPQFRRALAEKSEQTVEGGIVIGKIAVLFDRALHMKDCRRRGRSVRRPRGATAARIPPRRAKTSSSTSRY